jgi:uncharacterized repeat protein (TIGR01451 family)
MTIGRKLLFTIILGLTSFGLCTVAADNGKLDITIKAERQIEIIGEDGKKTFKLEPAEKVLPGDLIVYTIRYENRGTEAATSIAIRNPIPKQMRYREGSAAGENSEISYSVDSGKTFGKASQLIVVNDDGSTRPAVAEDYNVILWTLRDPVAPGQNGYASYQAQLK